MAFAARRSLTTRLSHHFTRRLNPGVPHVLTSRADDDPACLSPPPPLQAPLLRGSTGAQTGSLLPFSLHVAGMGRRSFSSSAPAPTPDSAPPAGVDATSLVMDAVDAAVSVPAPYPGEVAAAAADSFVPVAALQHLMDAVHSFTGLNWWASIALTTLVIRSATVPLLVNQLKATTKLNALKPEMEAIKDQMDTADLKTAQEGQKKMKELFKKHGVSPFTPLKGMLIQAPIFMSFFFAINNMVEKVPSLKGGGILWFTDLTTPDSLYIFPVLTGLTFLATVELNLQEGMEGNPMAGKMKMFSRGMAFMTVPFTMNFAKGIFCYWITSNIFSLMYGVGEYNPRLQDRICSRIYSLRPKLLVTVIRRPAIRKLFNLPPLVPQSSAATKPTFNLFGGSKAIPATQPPAALMGSQSDAAALGYRVKNLEKKVKSRGKSRKNR